jgi:hypothetical protein
MRSAPYFLLFALFAVGCADESSDPGAKHPTDQAPAPSGDVGRVAAPAATPPAQPPSRLFVIGGDDGANAQTDVWSAELLDDGTLKEFRAEGALPSARTRHAVVLSGQSILVLGGDDDTSQTGVRILATPEALGNGIVSWQDQGALQRATSSFATASNGIDVMVIGGQEHTADTRLLEQASMVTLDRGAVRGSHEIAPLPSARSRFAAARLGSYVYAVGGETSSGPLGEVLFGHVRDDNGWITRWDAAAPLSSPRVDHAVVASGDHVFSIAGYTGNAIIDEVSVAYVSDQGQLHGWDTVSKLPSPRYAHCATTSGAHIYVVGGLSDQSPLDEVLETTANANGTLEPWRIVGHIPAGRAHAGCVVR